ncbi:MAG: Fic family protein [Thermodesulfobacteriota bacterium]
MRTYERTHPWLTFDVDLRRAPAKLWIMLGECQSKCEHISWAPLLPETQKRLHQLYLAKGSLATTAIEGNTLSEKEVLLHLEKKLKLPPSKKYLAQEVQNIVDACNEILAKVETGEELRLSSEGTKAFNSQALRDLDLDDDVVPGEIRRHSVGVSRYKAPPHKDCDFLLAKLCDWLNGPTFAPAESTRIVSAVIRAVLAHLYLAWIHPFGDGNGRTARLVEFQILISSGVPAPAAHLLSNHYNLTRTEYYRQLDKASRSGGDVVSFLLYGVQGFLDGLRNQLDELRSQQWQVVWRDYVWGSFRERRSPSDERRRQLVFALSRSADAVPLSKVDELAPRLTKAYAGRTSKTLSRDVNALVSMGLVVKSKGKVRARKEAILGFLLVGTTAHETWREVMGEEDREKE